MGYVIAAYGIVIGSIVAYALWMRGQRRRLMAQSEQDPNDSNGI